MTEQSWPDWYPAEFERAAKGGSPELLVETPEDLGRDLQFVSSLAAIDLSAESKVRISLREKLARMEEKRPAKWSQQHPKQEIRPIYMRLAGFTLVLLFLLTLTNAPVLAAFSRLFGYGYLNQIGFIRLDQTLLLPGPLVVEGEKTFSIRLAVTDHSSTRIWASGALDTPIGLLLESGKLLPLLRAENHADESVIWFFEPLPAGQTRPILILQNMTRIPLGLVPASEVGLNPTAVSLPQRTPSSSIGQPCLDPNPGQRLCIQAAQVDDQGLLLLVEVRSEPGFASPDISKWEIVLEIPNGPAIPLKTWLPGDGQGMYSLVFSPFPILDGQVTLRAGAAGSSTSNELVFILPKAKPAFSPTPRAIQVPDLTVPVSTPGKN